MAIYKPTNCDPQLMTLDLADCASTPLFLYAKLDSTNTTVTHYSLRLLDEQNNELLNGSSVPYSLVTLQTRIASAGYTTYLADYINANTGYNGTYLVTPLIVPYDKRNAFDSNINIMYYDSGNVRNSSGTNLGISNGHSYKWELSLYQGTQSTARPTQVIYYDMVLTSGVVLGSTNKRIQTVPSDEIVSDYYIQPVSIINPSFIPTSSSAQTNSFLNTDYGEKGWYFTDGTNVNTHVQSMGPRIPIKTYDSQFGHIYPYDNGSDSFLPSQFKYSATASDSSVARGYRLYKMSGNPEDLTEKQKVKVAPYGAIPWHWNHSTENPSNSYGSFTYYMNKSMYSEGDPVYPFAENMTCAYAEQVSGSTFAYGIYFLSDGKFITGSASEGVKLWNSNGTLITQNLAGSEGTCFISNCVIVSGTWITTFIIQNNQLYYLNCNISTYSGSADLVGAPAPYSLSDGRLACCKNGSTLYAYVMLSQSYIATTSKNVTQSGTPSDLVSFTISGGQIGNITRIGFASEDDYTHLYACGTDSDGNAALFRADGPVASAAVTFSKKISSSSSGALAHLPYRDEEYTSNFYCSMGDQLYISTNSASSWTAYSNASIGLPAVRGVETPVRAYLGTSQNWITVVNQKEIWTTQDIYGSSIPWMCLYVAENVVPFGLPFNRNSSGSTPFVYAAASGLYRCVGTASQNIFVCAQKANAPIYSGDRILLAFQPAIPSADDTSGNNYTTITNPIVPFKPMVPSSQTSSKFNGIYVVDVSIKYLSLTIAQVIQAQQVEDFVSTYDSANTVQVTVVCRRSADADAWGEISNKVVYVQPLSVFATAPTPTPLYAGQNVQIPKSVVDSAGNNGRINKTAITFGPEEAVDLYSRGDAWSSSVSYTTGDIVQYNGHAYVALQNGTNQNPSSATSYWRQNDAVNSVGLIFYNVPKTTTDNYGKLYIRPYSGLRPDQWLREITTGNNPYNIITFSVNTKYWYVTYYRLFTGDTISNNVSSGFEWYTPDETEYKILTNYRVGDEIYFSFKAKPIAIMTFSSLYGQQFGIGSCNITQPAFTVTATCQEYLNGAPISKWRSYYFVVKDSNGNEVQRSRVKYDNVMSASFFGLPGAADVPASSFPTYNVELHVTSVDGVEIVSTSVITSRYSNPLCPHNKYVRFEYDCCRGCVKVIICTDGQECDITTDHKRVFVSKREVWAGDKTGQQETVTIDGQTRTVDVYDKYSEPLYHPVLIDAKLYGIHNYTEDGEYFYVFNDYNVASNRQYEYIYYILDDSDSSLTVINHRTGVVKTKTNRWTVTELDYDLSYDDATVYGVNPNNVWMFKYNADGGSQVLNTSKTQQDTLAQYPFFSMGPKRHMSGSISCLLGIEFLRSNMVTELPQYYYNHISADYVQWKVYGLPTGEPVEAGGYQERLRSKDPNDFVHLSSNQAIDMINQWRNLCYSGRPKLLKSPKGDIYIVQITNSQSTAQYTWNKMPDTISFDWTEIADPYDAIIIGEDDGYECNPCE